MPTLNRETSRLRTDGPLLLPDMTGSREDALWDREIMTCIVHVPRRTQLDTALPRTYYSAYRATSSFLPQLAIPASNSLCGTRFLSASALDDLGHQEGATGDSTSMVTRVKKSCDLREPRTRRGQPPADTLTCSTSLRSLAQALLCATFVPPPPPPSLPMSLPAMSKSTHILAA